MERRFHSLSGSLTDSFLTLDTLGEGSVQSSSLDPNVSALNEKISKMRVRMLEEQRTMDQELARIKLVEDRSPENHRVLRVQQAFLVETENYLSGIRDWCEKNGMNSPDMKSSYSLLQLRNHDTRTEARRRIDENWSLGTSMALGVKEGENLTQEVETSLSGGLEPSRRKERQEVLLNHTEELVKTLNVVFGNPTLSDPVLSHTERAPDFSSSESRRPLIPDLLDFHDFHDTQHDVGSPSHTRAHVEDSHYLNLLVEQDDISLRVPDRNLESVTEEEEEEDGLFTTPDSTISDMPNLVESESDSDTDSDTWGGPFSLRHICCRSEKLNSIL